MKFDHNFTYMTETRHDTERTEKVVPHLAKISKECPKMLGKCKNGALYGRNQPRNCESGFKIIVLSVSRYLLSIFR